MMLDAARDIFVNQGYEAVTMRKIAEKIDYSPTAIYSYFRDKDALLRAVSDADLGDLIYSLQKIKAPNALEHLRQVAHAYVKFGLTKPNQYRLLFMNVVDPQMPIEPGEPRAYDAEMAGYSMLLESVREMIALTEIDLGEYDPATIAQVLWSSFHGLISLQIALNKEPWIDWQPMEERVDALFYLLINGLQVKSAALVA